MPATLLPEPPVLTQRPRARPRLDSGGGGPPDRHQGEGGDGGGGGGGDGHGDNPGFPFRPGKVAMVFLLFSLSVLFVVTLAATLMLRRGAETWPPPGAPPFPKVLWANTAVLLASSVCLRLGVARIARGDARALTRAVGATTVLGVLFLAGQLEAWRGALAVGETLMSSSHGVIFYWLTGLHGVHVVGGVVFLLVCWVKALLRRYTAEAHLGVELCELYWHFLGVVWIVLVLTLFCVL